MRLKILSFAAIAMLFAACSSDEPNLPPEAENIPQIANPYRVSLDDALDNAETLLSQISEAETRSGEPTHTENDEIVDTLPYDFNLNVKFLGGFSPVY